MTQTTRVCALLLLAAGLASPVAAQTPPPLATAIVWDYTEEDLTFFAVTHFEVCFDGAATCARTIPSASFTDAQTEVGAVSFGVDVPALRVGPHTAAIVVCNETGCSEPETVTFVIAMLPTPPTNGRPTVK